MRVVGRGEKRKRRLPKKERERKRDTVDLYE